MIGRRPILWFLPLLLVLTVFLLYPTLDIIRLSFANARLNTEQLSYSLDNYRILFGGGQFYGILVVTVIFVVASVAFQLFLDVFQFRREAAVALGGHGWPGGEEAGQGGGERNGARAVRPGG